MPPTLRSAQSSPTGKPALLNASPGIAPGRKAPKCAKCAQSRRGHPRSGCPNVAKSEDMSTSPTKERKERLEEDLSKALKSIGLGPLVPEECHGRHPVGYRARITASKDNDSKRSKGQNTTAPIKFKMNSGPQTLMPGTLKAPSWESSIEGLPNVELSPTKNSIGIQTSFRGFNCDAVSAPLSDLQFKSPPLVSKPLPLQRSQTLEQRQLFLASLSRASPASVYIHKRQDVDEVKVSAEAAKLHVRPVYNEDKEEEDVLLVIGSDLNAVEKLAEELTESIENPKLNTASNISNTAGRTSSASSTFKAVASGAIMGALGTWAGLAFS